MKTKIRSHFLDHFPNVCNPLHMKRSLHKVNLEISHPRANRGGINVKVLFFQHKFYGIHNTL